MSSKTICDRCDSLVPKSSRVSAEEASSSLEVFMGKYGYENYDFCDECTRELVDWLDL